jgi:hypothetical protein
LNVAQVVPYARICFRITIANTPKHVDEGEVDIWLEEAWGDNLDFPATIVDASWAH